MLKRSQKQTKKKKVKKEGKKTNLEKKFKGDAKYQSTLTNIHNTLFPSLYFDNF